MKRIGSILILLILAFSMVSQLWVFAEAKTIDLPDAYEGSYYHQEATIADVLAGTEYEQYTSMLVIAGIKLISGEVPPGLTYTYTKDAVVFKGTPTKTGKYSFTVEVTGRAPLMDMEETAEAIVNIEVKEGTPPDVPKEYETPKFITSPAEFYEVNRGGSLSIQVSAKCAEMLKETC